MSGLFLVLLFLATALGSIASQDPRAKVVSAKAPASSKPYIAVFREDASEDEIKAHYKWLEDLIHKNAHGKGGGSAITFKYDFGTFHGYSGRFDALLAQAIREKREIGHLEVDEGVSINHLGDVASGVSAAP